MSSNKAYGLRKTALFDIVTANRSDLRLAFFHIKPSLSPCFSDFFWARGLARAQKKSIEKQGDRDDYPRYFFHQHRIP